MRTVETHFKRGTRNPLGVPISQPMHFAPRIAKIPKSIRPPDPKSPPIPLASAPKKVVAHVKNVVKKFKKHFGF